MSASREKNKRKEQAQNVTPEVKNEKKGMSKGGKTALGIVIAVLAVAVIVFFSMLTTGFFAKHTTAATVGEHKLTPAMVDYFSTDAYSSFVTNYSSYLSLFFDKNTALSEQTYNEETGESWADYFITSGLTKAASAYAIYDEAIANGFALTEDQEASIQSQLDQLRSAATVYGYSSIDSFLAGQYGSGCNEKSYTEYMRINTIAQAYASSIADGLTYTDDQINAEYAANPNDYDGVTFRYFTFNSSRYTETTDSETELTDEEQQAQSDKAMADAKAAAEEMASKITDEQSFINLSLEYAAEDEAETYAEANATLHTDVAKSSAPSSLADWLFDADRAEGDVTTVEASTGYQVAYFVSRQDHDVLTKNVRHILIKTEDGATSEEIAQAQATAEDVLARYRAGEQTEDAFAALSEELLNDGTASEATSYNIHPNQMVQTFEDWCYDESRQPGDTAVIQSEYGFHVMYFVGDGDNYRHQLVENALKNNDYTIWYTGVTEKVTYEKASGMAFVTKK